MGGVRGVPSSTTSSRRVNGRSWPPRKRCAANNPSPSFFSSPPPARRKNPDEYGCVNIQVLRNPSIGNVMDCCSISLPFKHNGATIGVMLTAVSGHDIRLLNLASTAAIIVPHLINSSYFRCIKCVTTFSAEKETILPPRIQAMFFPPFRFYSPKTNKLTP